MWTKGKLTGISSLSRFQNTEYFQNYLLNTCKDARYTYKSSNVGRLTNELNITWRVLGFCPISTLEEKKGKETISNLTNISHRLKTIWTATSNEIKSSFNAIWRRYTFTVMIKLLAVNLNFDNLVRLGVWKAVGH